MGFSLQCSLLLSLFPCEILVPVAKCLTFVKIFRGCIVTYNFGLQLLCHSLYPHITYFSLKGRTSCRSFCQTASVLKQKSLR